MICDISTNSSIKLSDIKQSSKSGNKSEFFNKSEYERAFEKEILDSETYITSKNNKKIDFNKIENNKIENNKIDFNKIENNLTRKMSGNSNVLTASELKEEGKSSENIDTSKISSSKTYFLTYSFSSEEVCLLAKFLRDKQDELPEGLENLNLSLERAVYNNLTLEEAKRFYS